MLLIPRYVNFQRHFPENISFKVAGFIKPVLRASALYFHFVEIMCSYQGAISVLCCSTQVSARELQQWAPTQQFVQAGPCPLYCTNHKSAPGQSWATHSHSPGIGNCDRKLISYIELSPWMQVLWVALCSSWSRRSCSADRKKLRSRDFCWSLTGFSVLGSSNSGEPAILGYVAQYWMFIRNSFFKNLLLSQLKWESSLKLDDARTMVILLNIFTEERMPFTAMKMTELYLSFGKMYMATMGSSS